MHCDTIDDTNNLEYHIMTKKNYKFWVKEFQNQSAKIPYKEYIKILKKEFDITEEKRSHSSGSKRSFIIKGNYPFVIHEPHGSYDTVGKWDHKNVLELLKQTGVIS